MPKLLKQDEIEALRRRQLANLFQSVDRTLSGSYYLRVYAEVFTDIPRLSGMADIPAFTDQSGDIFINMRPDMFPKSGDSDDMLLQFAGRNYHELGHVLYSPDLSNVGARWLVGDRKLMNAWNILEDQRMERLMVNRWNSLRNYFASVVIQLIMNNPHGRETAHILTHGRRYLPKRVRNVARREFMEKFVNTTNAPGPLNVRKGWLKRVEEIIDNYRMINVASVTYGSSAESIVREFQDLLDKLMADPEKQAHLGGQHRPAAGTEGDKGGGFEKTQQINGKDRAAREENWKTSMDRLRSNMPSKKGEPGANEEEGFDFPEFEDNSDSSSKGQGASGKPDKDGKGAGNAGRNDKTETTHNASSARGDGASGGRTVGSATETHSDDWGDAIGDLRKIIRQDSVANGAMMDMDQVRNILKNGRLSGLPITRHVVDKDGFVTTDMRSAALSIEKRLRRTLLDADPGWQRGVDSGRINVARVATGRPLSEVYDRWQEDQMPNVDIEVVAMLDMSGSMNRQMNRASQMIWTVRRGFERSGMKITTLGFGDPQVDLLYGEFEKTSQGTYRIFGSPHGTTVTPALMEAARIFHYSAKPYQVLIIQTDGQWHDAQNADRVVRRLNDAGVHTSLLVLGQSRWGTHNCKQMREISDMSEMGTYIKELIEQMLKNNLKTRRK